MFLSSKYFQTYDVTHVVKSLETPGLSEYPMFLKVSSFLYTSQYSENNLV